MNELQAKIKSWVIEVFGLETFKNKKERNLRFLEEALELVQSLDLSERDVINTVKYVYGRKVGQPKQEVGGVAVTLFALCSANDIDFNLELWNEYQRILKFKNEIKEKQDSKPKQIKG